MPPTNMLPSIGPESMLSLGMIGESIAYMGDPEVLAKNIHQNQIGHAVPFKGPFGTKQVLYCDFIASGRSLAFIEDYINDNVLPLYANTHTTTTVTALQTTQYRNEARNIIRGAVNASSDLDAVIFTGSGCTGAIHKLISSLYLDKLEERPLVLISGQEHHSNLLPWREAGCEIITIAETQSGEVNADDLERKLLDHRKASKRRMIIGLFSAASNVSGILNDDLTLTAVMHKYGGLAFWDYATAAPYVNIDMNPNVEGDENGLCAKDAIYFSMHKFVGGPQTPGVLIAKKELFRNPVPHAGGGGTVVFVTDKDHYYVSKIEDREEGGTPAIIESIRAGLVMHIKENIGPEYIMTREEKLLNMARERIRNMDNMVMLGPIEAPKLPILSFMIKCPTLLGNGYLHHNFVCFVLNDVFGIQARGGCACAGPYVEHLLGMNEEKVRQFTGLIQDPYGIPSHMNPHINVNKFERLKPGFARLSLPWFAPDEEIEYILDALEMVARDGWKLLPQYEFNSENGEWHHQSRANATARKWLNDINFYKSEEKPVAVPAQQPTKSWSTLLLEAEKVFATAAVFAKRAHVPDQRSLFTNGSAKYRWFILPFEAKQALLSPNSISNSRQINAPFEPRTYPPPKNRPEGFHDVGAYTGVFNMSPQLQKILEKTSRQRAFVTSVSKASSASREKMWFNKTWLPNLMGSKTMTAASKTNLQHQTTNGNGGSVIHGHGGQHGNSGGMNSRGSSHCEDCTDEEEEYSKPYWNHKYLSNSRHHLNTLRV